MNKTIVAAATAFILGAIVSGVLVAQAQPAGDVRFSFRWGCGSGPLEIG